MILFESFERHNQTQSVNNKSNRCTLTNKSTSFFFFSFYFPCPQNASKPEEMEISYAPPYEIPRSVHESSSEVFGQN